MVDELPGESLPEGIDVDDAAAYFGVTESSDMLHTLMGMERMEACLLYTSDAADE